MLVVSTLASCDSFESEKSGSMTDLSNINVPTLGEHALAFQRIRGGLESIATPPVTLSGKKSILVASVGRGKFEAFGQHGVSLNERAFRQIGDAHTYTRWPNSGTALYALENPPGDEISTVFTETPPSDEVTLAVVEVFGSRIVDTAWVEDLYPTRPWRLRRWLFSENSVKSGSVVTDGPATLVAFWWGDASVEDYKIATPDSGFRVIDAILEPGSLVQCAVAIKKVEKAGRYRVKWTNSPLQGAQLYLVAVADHSDDQVPTDRAP